MDDLNAKITQGDIREIEQLKARIISLRNALDLSKDAIKNVTLNAKIVPDQTMGGLTDIYAVPLDDIESLNEILKVLSNLPKD